MVIAGGMGQMDPLIGSEDDGSMVLCHRKPVIGAGDQTFLVAGLAVATDNRAHIIDAAGDTLAEFS